MATLTISGKAIGVRKRLFDDWSIPFPPPDSDGGRLTLRDLIGRIVRAEVQAFRHRQDERRVFRVLTARDIAEGTAKGKVASGGSEVPAQDIDEDEAVEVACQAFADGLYLVVIDDVDYRELDCEVHLQADTRLTFVRLTMLAGG